MSEIRNGLNHVLYCCRSVRVCFVSTSNVQHPNRTEGLRGARHGAAKVEAVRRHGRPPGAGSTAAARPSGGTVGLLRREVSRAYTVVATAGAAMSEASMDALAVMLRLMGSAGLWARAACLFGECCCFGTALLFRHSPASLLLQDELYGGHSGTVTAEVSACSLA